MSEGLRTYAAIEQSALSSQPSVISNQCLTTREWGVGSRGRYGEMGRQGGQGKLGRWGIGELGEILFPVPYCLLPVAYSLNSEF